MHCCRNNDERYSFPLVNVIKANFLAQPRNKGVAERASSTRKAAALSVAEVRMGTLQESYDDSVMGKYCRFTECLLKFHYGFS